MLNQSELNNIKEYPIIEAVDRTAPKIELVPICQTEDLNPYSQSNNDSPDLQVRLAIQ